jgi:ADP-ribosylglycohydrolase
MTMTLPLLDKYKAVILGLAIGDALGAPTEFKSMASIRAKFGPDGITDMSECDGKFTDDTQMTVALAEGLLDAWDDHVFQRAEDLLLLLLGFLERVDLRMAEESAAWAVNAAPAPIPNNLRGHMANPDTVMPYIANRFKKWAFGPKNNRAPGTTCMAGCRALKAGKRWTESGVMSSKGCGSAMRSSPVGLVYSDPDTLEKIARASSIVTHGHQAALDAAHAAALVVRALLDGTLPRNLLGIVTDVCVKDDRFHKLLMKVEQLVADTINGTITPEVAQTHAHLGESWTGDEAVASALYCFLLAFERGEGYVETVRYGANTCGDSDSIAAIAGSFAGAFWGIGGRGVPEVWIEQVEDATELELLAQRLYDLAQGLGSV